MGTRKEFVGSFFCSTVIDVDHFLAAGSLRIKDAVNLPSRPLLHCSSLLLLPLLLALLLRHSLHLRPLLLLLTCVFSHHLRDSIRRGLWFCPVGQTPSLPFPLYLFILPLFSRLALGTPPLSALPLTTHDV